MISGVKLHGLSTMIEACVGHSPDKNTILVGS